MLITKTIKNIIDSLKMYHKLLKNRQNRQIIQYIEVYEMNL